MESVASMDRKDRDAMSTGYGDEPWFSDAGSFTWCNRPRYYWVDWGLVELPGVHLGIDRRDCRSITFEGCQPLNEVLRSGWDKVDKDIPFPTFTTSRPSVTAGRKPAGIQQCTWSERQRWHDDSHRFPPYQYRVQHCVQDRHGNLRVPGVVECEAMLGFPVNYTLNCLSKAGRSKVLWEDVRKTLLGNTWRVPVVACLLQQLFSRLGLCVPLSPQEVLDRCHPSSVDSVQGRLFRLPLNLRRASGPDCSSVLASKLGNFISVKGEDILLTSPEDRLQKFHRLRATVPSKLWKWRIVTGWRWRSTNEHINALELPHQPSLEVGAQRHDWLPLYSFDRQHCVLTRFVSWT